MLSILIPTYNYDALTLVRDLHHLAERQHIDHEIIISDDASTEPQPWLQEAAAIDHVRVLVNEHNLGRAANRNRLGDAAQGQWLLFVDSDARVEDDFSLQLYLNASFLAPVVCGGLRHPSVNPNPAATLRYKYERRADAERTAEYREQEPFAHLSTFNILVSRDVFAKIRFDEHCTDYGYEDTLFGADLEAHGYRIQHIDNPLVHVGIEDNATYLAKVETALRTLHSLNGRLGAHSRVETAANNLRSWHLTPVVKLLHTCFGSLVRLNLLSRHPSLTLFQAYKLGYYLSL